LIRGIEPIVGVGCTAFNRRNSGLGEGVGLTRGIGSIAGVGCTAFNRRNSGLGGGVGLTVKVAVGIAVGGGEVNEEARVSTEAGDY